MSQIAARIGLSIAKSMLSSGGSKVTLRPGLRLKEAKFDAAKVLAMAERGNRRAKFQAGAYVRKVARGSIRKRKRSSDAGNTPSSHTGLLKSSIQFAVEPSGTVVVGPGRLSGSIGPKPISQTLEHGGEVTISEVYHKGHWVRRTLVKNARGLRTRTRRVRVAPRPYMGPSLYKAGPALAKFWQNSVQ